MSNLKKLENYLRAYKRADQFFESNPTYGDPYNFEFLIHFPLPLQSSRLPIFDVRTIVLLSLRRLARAYLTSPDYEKNQLLREGTAAVYLEAIDRIKKAATLDAIRESVDTLKLPFKGEREKLIEFVQPEFLDSLSARATMEYFKTLQKELEKSEARYLAIDLLTGILHLQDAALIKPFLNIVTEDKAVLYFLKEARALFNGSSTPNKQTLIQSIEKYRHTVLGTMLLLHRMVNNIDQEKHKKEPQDVSRIYIRQAFSAGKFFAVEKIGLLPSSLKTILTKYLGLHQQGDCTISPLNVLEELKIPDTLVIKQKRLIEMRDPRDCLQVYARQLARRYLRESRDNDLLNAGSIFSAFLLVFSCLNGGDVTRSDIISALSALPERERAALCECLISMIKHDLDVTSSFDARFTPLDTLPVTMQLESGAVRVPDLVIVVKCFIRGLMHERMRNLDPNEDRFVTLNYLLVCAELIATIGKQGLASLVNHPLLAFLPSGEVNQLSRFVAEETITQFQVCHQTILSQGDFFVFSEHLTVLRLRLENLEKLITALSINGLRLTNRQLMINKVSGLDSAVKQAALACLQDEFNAEGITPKIEERLRDLLQGLQRQQQHLATEIAFMEEKLHAAVRRRADRDLRSTLDCFRAFDEYVLSTTRLENLDLSQPVKLAPFHGVNFPPIVAFRTMLLVAMRQKIREHIQKNPTAHEACDGLLSKVTAASLDQLLDVINGLTSEVVEVQPLIDYIKQLFNKEVVFGSYVQHQVLIDACDLSALHECMAIIRGQLAKGDYSNEPFLTALEMMAADVQASQRLCQRVYSELIARDPQVVDDWLFEQEQQFDKDKLTQPQLYLESCRRFDSEVRPLEWIGLLEIQHNGTRFKVWDLQTWAAMGYRRGDAADRSLAIKIEGLELSSVPDFLNQQKFTNEQMCLACLDYGALNSTGALAHIEALIEEIRREYEFFARKCYQQVKQSSDHKEQFNDIILVCQQLYQQLEFLKRLNNNMLLTSRVSDSLKEKVNPVALESLTNCYKYILNSSQKALDNLRLADAKKRLDDYLSRYEVFDACYDGDRISLGREHIIPDPYTRVMIEIRGILREHLETFQPDEITAFSKFLHPKDPIHLKSGPTVRERVEDVLNFLKSHSRYFPEAWVTKRERGYAVAVEALLHSIPDEFDNIMTPAINAAAVLIQEIPRELSQDDWVRGDFSQDFQHAGPNLRKNINLLEVRVRELETHRQAFMRKSTLDTLVTIQKLLIEILPSILDIPFLYEAQLLADQESLWRLCEYIGELQRAQQKRDAEAAARERAADESQGAAAAARSLSRDPRDSLGDGTGGFNPQAFFYLGTLELSEPPEAAQLAGKEAADEETVVEETGLKGQAADAAPPAEDSTDEDDHEKAVLALQPQPEPDARKKLGNSK